VKRTKKNNHGSSFKKNSLTVVSHIPMEITCTCHFFIKNKEEITGEVSRR